MPVGGVDGIEVIITLGEGVTESTPVPVVRCRDCERYREHMWMTVPEFEPLGTDIDDVCTFFADGVKVSPDGFCAWGCRRADDEAGD